MTQEDESRFYARVFWLTAAALLALALLSILKPFFESILWAGLLAFLLAPVTRWLTRAFRGRRSLAALLVTLAGALFVLIPAVVTAVVFAGQASELVAKLQEIADRFKITQASDVFLVPALDRLVRWVSGLVSVSPEQIQGLAIQGSKSLLILLVASSGAFFAGVLGVVIELTLTLMLLFFFLRDGEAAMARGLLLIP